jgi:hypothetical protein
MSLTQATDFAELRLPEVDLEGMARYRFSRIAGESMT